MNFKTLLAWLAFTLISGCNLMGGKEDTPAGTEVENEIVGLLFLADGSPAGGAKVKLVPVDWIPRPGLADSEGVLVSATADAQGEYHLKKMQTGRYNILGASDSKVSFQDSVEVTKTTRILPSDTLDAAGFMTGYVLLQPNHPRSSATVEILGTQSYANVDDSGQFTFTGLGAGRYSIRVATTLPEYTPLYSGFRVRSGQGDTLADTLKLAYTGIPVVQGLQISYDTLRGIVHFGWHQVSYALKSEYAVFRDSSGYQQLSTTPFARLADTTFVDIIFPNLSATQEEMGLQEDLVSRYEYRVKVINKSDRMGENFGFIAVNAPSPAWVRTFMDLSVSGQPRPTVSVGDSVRIALAYRNKTRSNDSLIWTTSEGELPVRLRGGGLKASGTDSLTLVASKIPGTMRVAVRMRDDAGSWWERGLSLDVVLDAPKANAGTDTSASTGLDFTVKGSAMQKFGVISKWEWDIGAQGVFRQTGGPDTTFPLPENPDTNFRCVIRVTDDDGNQDIDTVRIQVLPSRWAKPFLAARQGMAAVALNGKIYLMGGIGPGGSALNRVDEFDPVTGVSIPKAPMNISRIYAVATVLDGKIYVAKAGARTSNNYSGNIIGNPNSILEDETRFSFERYDPATDQWSLLKPSTFSGPVPNLNAVGGKIYLQYWKYDSSGVYDVSSNTWKLLANANPYDFYSNSTAVLDGRIFFNSDDSKSIIYDVNDESWTQTSKIPEQKISRHRTLCSMGGKLYAFGGELETFEDYKEKPIVCNSVFEYFPATDKWVEKYPMLTNRAYQLVVELNSRFYIFPREYGYWDFRNQEEHIGTEVEEYTPY